MSENLEYTFDSFEFKNGLTKEQFKVLKDVELIAKDIKDKEEVLRYINYIFTGVYVPLVK